MWLMNDNSGFWVFESSFYAVDLYEPMVYNEGNQKLNGFRFYFEKPEMAKFEEIMSKL